MRKSAFQFPYDPDLVEVMVACDGEAARRCLRALVTVVPNGQMEEEDIAPQA